MGQSPNPVNRLNNQWNFVDNIAGIQIYKNQHNQLAEKHIVKTDPKIDEQDYITAYYQRYLPNKPIVNVFDAQFLQKTSSMCQNTTVMTVFTEYIPYRLSDVKTLNHGQGVYVLSEALAGFSELFRRVGPFQIHQDLIGFNQQGQVKVWYNPNFADNSVDNDRIILMSTINPYDFDRKFSQNQQHDMIEDIINSVARYTQFNPQFLQQAQELKKMNFFQARKILSNQIARKAYYVPDHLFLDDKSDILKKSGVELKHRHVVDPNKPRAGTSYPYFVDNNHNASINQQGYNNQVYQQQGYTESNDTSDSSSDYNQGGYYNLNGQNYRIIGTKEIDGNEINQQAILDEIIRKNNPQPQHLQHVYSQVQPTPNYTQVASRYEYQQVSQHPQQQQYIPKPYKQYHEGHIVIREDDSRLVRNVNSTVLPALNYNQSHSEIRSQQNVKIFSVGENGRLVEERQSSINPNYQHSQVYHHPSTYQSNLNVPTSYQSNIVQPQIQYQQSSFVKQGGNNSTVYPLNFSQNVQQQSIPSTFSHRHKIFEPVSPQRMVRESGVLPQQKAF